MSVISVLNSTVPVNGLSLIQRSPTHSVCLCDRESLIMGILSPAGCVEPW